MYRPVLFGKLMDLCPKDYFKNKEILEIGPKDGRDSERLSSLQPSKLTMVDLPEKRDLVDTWLEKITCPKEYIEANFMYSSLFEPDRFSLIWCTGVLYHNAEQLRMLRKFYHLLKPDGYLVIESAVTRNQKLSDAMSDVPYVEIHYPETYRQTTTVTHLPNEKAINAWLLMSGFEDVHASDCYNAFNSDLIGQRYAAISRKKKKIGSTYFHKSNKNPLYYLGDSL
jgi:2-polyprenyl-3-methyl-5-hydroxy-6-metoxy-1,4-benzoquinol methylase